MIFGAQVTASTDTQPCDHRVAAVGYSGERLTWRTSASKGGSQPIPSADVVGYSRLRAMDEIGTLFRLNALRPGLIDPANAAPSGVPASSR
jgi:hypothetical protein